MAVTLKWASALRSVATEWFVASRVLHTTANQRPHVFGGTERLSQITLSRPGNLDSGSDTTDCGCSHCLYSCSRTSLGVARFGIGELGGEVVVMPCLIETPALIWVAVVPVDMRRGLDGLSTIVQQSLDQRLFFATKPATACVCCCGKSTACGCPSAVCIKVVLYGLRSMMPSLCSARRSGNG